MTRYSAMPIREENPIESGQGRRLKRKRPNIKQRKRGIAAVVFVAVLVIAVVSLVVATIPLLEGKAASSVGEKTSAPLIVMTNHLNPGALHSL